MVIRATAPRAGRAIGGVPRRVKRPATATASGPNLRFWKPLSSAVRKPHYSARGVSTRSFHVPSRSAPPSTAAKLAAKAPNSSAAVSQNDRCAAPRRVLSAVVFYLAVGVYCCCCRMGGSGAALTPPLATLADPASTYGAWWANVPLKASFRLAAVAPKSF
jgi:hypothetical protein